MRDKEKCDMCLNMIPDAHMYTHDGKRLCIDCMFYRKDAVAKNEIEKGGKYYLDLGFEDKE